MNTANPHRRALSIMWALLMLNTLAAPAAAAEDAGPTEFIKVTMHTLFDAVEKERANIDTDPKVARGLIRQLLTPHFDLERTCRWVLGKHWREATDEQRARMVTEFRTLLVRIYAAAIADFATLEMSYAPGEESVGNTDDVSVRAEAFTDGGNPTIVAYRLHRSEGKGWKVYDITVSGVSLVTTYRSTFASTIRDSGMDGLIERISQKNQES